MAFGSFNHNEGDTVTIPTHSVGDTIFIFAGRGNSTSTPTVPAGWKCANGRAFGGTTKAFLVFYRLAVSTSETSGTWTGAQFLVAGVYSATNYIVPIGQANNANGTANTSVTFGPNINAFDAVLASGFRMQNSSAFLLGCAYAKQSGAGLDVAPSGMTNIASPSGAASHQIGVNITSSTVANWTSTNLVVASAIDWITCIVELSDTGIPKSSGGGGASFPPIGPGGLVY